MNIQAEHYTYRTHWSTEDECYIGTVAEFPSLSWVADDLAGALAGAISLVGEVLNDMVASGETPPVPLSEKSYSGKFQVRIPPESHRRLAMEAAEQQVSLNRLVSNRLVA